MEHLINLNFAPGGLPATVHVSQYDDTIRQLRFQLWFGRSKVEVPSGASVRVDIKKPDGHIVLVNGTVNSSDRSIVTVPTTKQMTAVPGGSRGTLVVSSTGDKRISSAIFILQVHRDPVEDGDASDSDLSMLQDAIDQTAANATAAQAAATAAQQAASSFTTDTTLSVSGKAADAKKTGDELTAIKADLDNLEPGLSDTAKMALLNCFQHVYFVDEDNDYYGALEAALGGVSVTGLAASFSPSRNIYNIDTLDDLKEYLTVTATHSNGKSYVVGGYVLSGELNVGTNVITVTLNGVSTTFNVNVIDIFAVSTWSTSSDIAQIADGQTNIGDNMSSGIQFVANSEATGGSIRKHLASKIGILKYNNYDGTQLLDLYPIPIKNMANSATITVSPSSCYSFIKMFRYDPTDNKYKGAGSALGWAQGDRTMDISTWRVDGVRRFFCINLKADDAGTGEFSVQPTITITYGN